MSGLYVACNDHLTLATGLSDPADSYSVLLPAKAVQLVQPPKLKEGTHFASSTHAIWYSYTFMRLLPCLACMDASICWSSNRQAMMNFASLYAA